jgi:hypothetical protein
MLSIPSFSTTIMLIKIFYFSSLNIIYSFILNHNID